MSDEKMDKKVVNLQEFRSVNQVLCADIDLSGAILYADGGRGVYIPQHFAQTIRREFVSGVSEEDYKVLEAGPDHEHYWDAWADVMDNADIKSPLTGECFLYQDDCGNLWLIPPQK